MFRKTFFAPLVRGIWKSLQKAGYCDSSKEEPPKIQKYERATKPPSSCPPPCTPCPQLPPPCVPQRPPCRVKIAPCHPPARVCRAAKMTVPAAKTISPIPPPPTTPPIPFNPCVPHFPTPTPKRFKLIFVVMLPIIIYQSVRILSGHHEVPEHRPPCRDFEYMRRRTKRFPWGDGHASFFHNDEVNDLPGTCEDQPQPQECEDED